MTESFTISTEDQNWLAKHGLRQCVNGHVHGAAAEPNQSANQSVESLPADLSAALAKVEELNRYKQDLERSVSKSRKEAEGLQKDLRTAQLKSLVPRQLFRTEDQYNRELEKVHNMQGLSDEDIADLYQTKLRKIDSGVRQHGASITQSNRNQISPMAQLYNTTAARLKNRQYFYKDDPRLPVPQYDYHMASVNQQNNTNAEKISRVMRFIAGSTDRL